MPKPTTPKTGREWEKELDKFYIEEWVVCSKCKHPKEAHWWNGGGRVENSGYDACHSCDCSCLGDEVIEEHIAEHKYMTDFITNLLSQERQQSYIQGFDDGYEKKQVHQLGDALDKSLSQERQRIREGVEGTDAYVFEGLAQFKATEGGWILKSDVLKLLGE